MSITTHVLDTMRGTAAAGLEVTLARLEPNGHWKVIGAAVTDTIVPMLFVRSCARDASAMR